ncbi:MAG TPA: hypothetical protein PKM67_04075 [Kiritimatiellia bacterium]|nr:hypothetical protein [Kiritimatiellia bacterium]HNR94131.1 hypothetical protein [Kiritimatiellia bacterium]HNS80614.1 hypothetical protein [Kiritimatiellia bacterium]HPA79001.1 hypothetical protein [Kiritimatiellia bacterium]HQQ03442.1 hypothetical protein [Kiritimatiellia bacterium]
MKMIRMLILLAGTAFCAMAQEPLPEAAVSAETNALLAVKAQSQTTAKRVDRIEVSVAELEKTIGRRAIGSRRPSETIEDQLAEIERRLKRIERDVDDLERRLRRVERR